MARHAIARSIVAAGALTLLVVGAQATYAQNEPPNLETVTRLKCVFPVMSTGTWSKEGEPSTETKKSDLAVSFEAIDTSDGTAQAVGFTGNFYIVVRLVAGNLHLLATDASGPVYMTTVFNQPSHPGKYKAVQSRHEFTAVSLPGFTSRPEQYIGECEIVQ